MVTLLREYIMTIEFSYKDVDLMSNILLLHSPGNQMLEESCPQ